MFRRFQYEFDQFMRAQECGTDIHLLIGDICPGGGKSSLGPIFSHHGQLRGLIERVCWVTPRISLCMQAEEAFVQPWLRHLVGHSLKINASPGNRLNPDDGTFGYSTTFDAVDERPDLHLDYFRQHRTGLMIDEGQHVVDGSQRHRKLAELVRLSPLTLLMSGTLQRHDERPVAFLEYQKSPPGKYPAVLDNTATQQAFRYDWRSALSEEAIIPLVFHHVDGSARWRDANGEEQLVDKISETADDNDARSAIFTVLHEAYALELLSEAVAHFNAYRQTHPRAKFLCIAPRKKLADKYLKHIQRLGLARCATATSDDTPEALRNIERLKGNERPHLDGLVTVAMAYEGMDCPPITHVALLTHIRSMSWIYQALSRATRHDRDAGAWSQQMAHCFCPDDALMNSIIDTIRAAQSPFMREPKPPGSGSGGGGAGTIVPMSGAIGSIRASEFETGFEASDREYRNICAAAERAGLSDSPLALKRFLDDYLTNAGCDEEEQLEKPKTHTDRKRELLHWCDMHVQAVAAKEGDNAGRRAHTINTDLMRRFGARDDMGVPSLEQLWYVDLPRLYPL